MNVCHCLGINNLTIIKCLEQRQDPITTTGASTKCGSCYIQVRKIVDQFEAIKKFRVKSSQWFKSHDWLSCFVYPEQTKRELQEIEAKLAFRYNIVATDPIEIRNILLTMDDDGKLPHDTLTSDWRATYASYLNDEMEQCYVSPEQCKQELEIIEAKLAEQYNLSSKDVSSIRQTLITMDKSNNLPEDELVADWHEAMAMYLFYFSNCP